MSRDSLEKVPGRLETKRQMSRDISRLLYCPGTLLLDHETSRDLGPVLSRDVSCPCLARESESDSLANYEDYVSIHPKCAM